jgi:Flp pilus assembly protein TadD
MKKIDVNFLEPSQQQLNSLLEYYQAGRYVDAEKLSLSITQEFPKHQFPWKVLGAALKQMGKINESLVALQKSVELNPQDAEAHNNLGITLQELGKLDEAEISYRQAIELKPDYAEAQYNLGITLTKLGRLNEAEASYGKAITLKPDYVKAHHNLGNTLKKLGKLDKAEASYRKAIELKPDFAEAHHNLGVMLQVLGRLDEAEASYRKAIELKPDYAVAHNNLGNTLKELGRLDEAEASYRKVITLKPDYAEAYNNLGVMLQELGRLDEAEASYRKAIELKPDLAEAYNNLGNTLKELGRLDEAEASYRKVITLKPDFAGAHHNLGVMLQELGKLDEAEASYRKVIELKPDFAKAYNNLGNTLKEQGRLDEAETSYKKAIALKPDYAEAYSNLGVMLQELGRLDEAEVSLRKAIALKPDLTEAWNNIFFLLQAISLQSSSLKDRIPLFDEQTNSKYPQILKSILSYRLNQGSPSTDKSFKEVLNILSSADNTFIKNPKVSSNKLIKPTLPEKITALVHFGRSGTGLMHSLIDGHPEVSTLPSIYFSEFFDHFTWKKIIVDGWEEMADRFATIYDILFDASSNIKIPTKGYRYISNIGQKEGMMNVGIKRDEVLSVDKKAFIKRLKQLMDYHDHLDQFTFFKLVHSAYEVAIENTNEKKLIFYHIHNPDTHAQLNFLRLAPNTNWLVMVREPIQSCELWVSKKFPNHYISVSNRIFQMLFEVDQAIYQNDNSIGVRLEDLKEHPKKTIQALCGWLGIKEEESLYQMTAQGKRWWGDGSSPEFAKDETEPFGKSSINHKVGLIFSENDQFILRTLFYPFSVRFGYAEENLEKFKKDLLAIRPMLDQMFDFEKKITQDTKVSTEKFMKSGPYLYLRSGMIERWNTLNKFHTYPNMLSPLKIN